MNDNQIRYLISKLRSNTLSQKELEEFNKFFDNYGNSKFVIDILQEDYQEIKNQLDKYPSYDNELFTKQRILNNISLKTESPKKRFRHYIYWAASVAIFAIAVTTFSLKNNKKNSQLTNVEWVTIETSPGVRKKIVLQDSTEIILNGNSEIQYPKLQHDKFRLVKIKGEGYFNVIKDNKRPLYVISPQYTTKVLGTSFNINTDIKSNIEVRTGLVRSFIISGSDSEKSLRNHFDANASTSSLSNLEQHGIELKAGESAILKNNSKWIKENHNNNFWFNNELVYFAEPLKNVIKSAYRNFGDSISIDKKLEDVNITITFRGKNKQQVIYTLAELANANVKINYKTNIWEMIPK